MGAQSIFESAKAKGMQPLDLLDIGGGFASGGSNFLKPINTFVRVAAQISDHLDNVWPGPDLSVKIIGEPGRQIVQESMTLIARIYQVKQQSGCRNYFINDGVFSAFVGQFFDNEWLRGQLMVP